MEKVKLGEQEQWIVDFLQGKDWVQPTKIGLARGEIEKRFLHSSWASPKCKKLVDKGILERSENGWYRFKKQEIKAV